MSLILDPRDYGMNADGRIVIYNLKKEKFFDRRAVHQNKKIVIDDDEIVNNLIDFKFKFQKKEGAHWEDVNNYFYLIKARFLRNYWTDKLNYSDEEVKEIILYCSKRNFSKDREIMVAAFKATLNYIIKSKTIQFENLNQYFRVLKENEIQVPLLWKNIHYYLEKMVELKRKFYEYDLIGIAYPDLFIKIKRNQNLKVYFEKEAKNIEESDLQFGYVLSGIINSFLCNRDKAARLFEKALTYKNNNIRDFNLGLGIATYIDESSLYQKEYNTKLNFDYQEKTGKRDLTFIVSLDPLFLRKYGIQMFYSIIALKKYHFHFHIVADQNEAQKIIEETKALFDQMKNYFRSGESIITPTFSSEECPEFVKQKSTFYACSRFINAEQFMDEFNSDIISIDADFIIMDDFKNMINKLVKNDVAMTIVGGFTSIFPWTRVMGGTLYLKNNDKSRTFISVVRNYIIFNLDKKNSWTLDQNAMTYGYEYIKKFYPEIKVGNISKYPRPLTQPPIRRFIES